MLNRPAIENTIQILPDAPHGTNVSGFFSTPGRGDLLPPRYTRERERALRMLYQNDYNGMFSSIVAGIAKKVSTTDYVIKGDDAALVAYYDGMLRNAQFGDGWRNFILALLTDFFRQDAGGYIEVIAPGDPRLPPVGLISGLAVLDSLRCVPTGDPTYPVCYYDAHGKLHLLHKGRVRRLVDMPEVDAANPGYGNSALSRAVSVVYRQILMDKYVQQSFDDRPPPGLMLAGGMDQKMRDAALERYRSDQSRDSLPEWGRTLWFYAMDPQNPITLSPINFTQPPEKFDYGAFTQINVDQFALVFGVDRQEIWQLTGGTLGSGAQSQVLDDKNKGKTLGDLLATIERMINQLLPRSLEFIFQRRDPQDDTRNAQTLATLTGAVSILISSNVLSPVQAAKLLASQSDPFRDATANADGSVEGASLAAPAAEQITVDDANPASDAVLEGQPAIEATPLNTPALVPNTGDDSASRSVDDIMKLLDAGLITIGDAQRQLGQRIDPDIAGMYMNNGTPVPRDVYIQLYETQFGRGVATFSTAIETAEAGTLITPEQEVVGEPTDDATSASAAKDFSDVAAQFERDFTDLIDGGLDDDVSRRRAGVVLRAQLKRRGTDAYREGLKAGGVDAAELDEDALLSIATWLAGQSSYVTGFLNDVFSEQVNKSQVAQHANLWVNKSLSPIYHEGIADADKNGMYLWTRNPAKDSCITCIGMDGQIHRMKDYVRTGILPQTGALVCGGWNCGCNLTKTSDRARGNLRGVRYVRGRKAQAKAQSAAVMAAWKGGGDAAHAHHHV